MQEEAVVREDSGFFDISKSYNSSGDSCKSYSGESLVICLVQMKTHRALECFHFYR